MAETADAVWPPLDSPELTRWKDQMSDTTPPAAKPKPSPAAARRTKTGYLVQSKLSRSDDVPEAWVDLGDVTVASRTPLAGILEAAREQLGDSFADLFADGASVRLRVTKADEIREQTVTLEPQAPRLKVGA